MLLMSMIVIYRSVTVTNCWSKLKLNIGFDQTF